MALAIPPVRALRRRARLRRAGREPRALILATYDVFTERAADLGHSKTPGETLREYRTRLAAGGVITDGHLDRLTSHRGTSRLLARRARRGRRPRGVGRPPTSVLHDLRERTPIGQRIAGQYRLRR